MHDLHAIQYIYPLGSYTPNLLNPLALRENYSNYSRRLSPGYLFNRKIDASDVQYSGFRNNIPLLVGVMVGSAILSKIVGTAGTGSKPGTVTGRIYLSLAVSLVYVFVLHGFGAVKLLILISMGYLLAGFSGKTAYFGIWIYGIGLLFLNNYFDGLLT
jgi:hypothetical protein